MLLRLAEGGTQFLASRSQVTSLLEIVRKHNVLTDDEAKIMQTVVQLRNKQIQHVMIPPQDIYMVAHTAAAWRTAVVHGGR